MKHFTFKVLKFYAAVENAYVYMYNIHFSVCAVVFSSIFGNILLMVPSGSKAILVLSSLYCVLATLSPCVGLGITLTWPSVTHTQNREILLLVSFFFMVSPA